MTGHLHIAEEKIRLYPLDGRLNEPQSRYEDGRREEPVTLGFPAPSLIPTSPTYLSSVMFCTYVFNGSFNDTIART